MSERKRVLIICDDIDMSRLMRMYYVKKEYEVQVVHRFTNGLLAAQEFQPDLILLSPELCKDFEEDLEGLKELAPNAEIITG